ncbi:hypothetical protein D3C71_2141570 [compost metagenome]
MAIEVLDDDRREFLTEKAIGRIRELVMEHAVPASKTLLQSRPGAAFDVGDN